TTYWEVKVKDGNQCTSVKINSQTGEVLSTEQDD
ncbi:lysis protein, partial [Enterococcus faecium]